MEIKSKVESSVQSRSDRQALLVLVGMVVYVVVIAVARLVLP